MIEDYLQDKLISFMNYAVPGTVEYAYRKSASSGIRCVWPALDPIASVTSTPSSSSVPRQACYKQTSFKKPYTSNCLALFITVTMAITGFSIKITDEHHAFNVYNFEGQHNLELCGNMSLTSRITNVVVSIQVNIA